MPINFTTLQHYSINYADLLDLLDSQMILDNKLIQSRYIHMWIEKLKESDKAITNYFKTSQSISDLKLFLQAEPEIFQQPININNLEILLHFRVSPIIKLIKSTQPNIEEIPSSAFIGEKQYVLWTPVNECVDSYSNSQDPVLLVPFFNGQYYYLVIDGNHRLTYKTTNNFDTIKSLTLAEKYIIDKSLFLSVFDKFYYIMNNELNHMFKLTRDKGVCSLELVEKSYLLTGEYNYA